MSGDKGINVTLEFAGGAENLFDKCRKKEITLAAIKDWSIRDLLIYIKDNLLRERPELFIQGDSVRPGILVLINDCDWELMGEIDYVIQPRDNIVFISTLHGG